MSTIYAFHQSLYSPLTPYTGCVNYIEALTGVVPNDSLLNTYYFWWTNPHYIIPFFALMITLTLSVLMVQSKLFWLIAVFMVQEIWFTELRDVLQSNTQLTLLTTLSPTFNILLLNSLNKYHPFIFYSSLFLLISLWIHTWYYRSHNYMFTKSNSSKRLNVFGSKIVALNFLALYFGSWWALQEGTWGGWWNWDSSELFGLLPTLVLLKFVHSKSKKNFFSLRVLKLTSLIFLVFLFYLLIQLNFELISHNFGPKFFFFFNSNLLTTILLSWTFLLWGALERQIIFIRLQPYLLFRNYGVRKFLYYHSAYISISTQLILISWYWIGFGPFLDYVFLLLLTPLSNLTLSVYPINLSLMIIFIIFLYSPSALSPVPTSVTILQGIKTVGQAANYSGYIHYWISLFIFGNLLLTNLTLYIWNFSTSLSLIDDTSSFLWKSPITWIVDSWSVDQSWALNDHQGLVALLWTTTALSNIESTNQFLLVLQASSLSNCYLLHSSNIWIFIFMKIPTLPLLGLITLFVARLSTKRQQTFS